MLKKDAKGRHPSSSTAGASAEASSGESSKGTRSWLLTVLAVVAILAAIATSTTLALRQTSEQDAALKALQSSGRLKHDLDVLQQLMLDEHEDLYTRVGTKPLYHRPDVVFPLKASLRLIDDAEATCRSRKMCLAQLDDLEQMLRLLAEKSDMLTRQVSDKPGSVQLGDAELGEIDAYFYSALQRVVSTRMQADTAIDNAVTQSSKNAAWVCTVLLACGAIAAVLLVTLILRDSRIAHKLRVALQQADLTKNELFKSKQTLEYVLDHVPQGIAWKDASHRYVGGNEVYAKDAGLASKNDLIGLSDFDLNWGDDPHLVVAEDLQVMAGELTRKHHERAATTVAGAEVWLSETKLPLEDQSGAVTGVLRAYEDITKRRHAEVVLRLQGRALEASINGIIIAEARDGRHTIIFCNEAYERITGYDAQDVLNADCEQLFALSGEPHKWKVVRDALESNEEANTTLLCVRKDGSRFWNNVLVAPVRDDSGTVTHHVGVMSDVTALVEYQHRLEHQARYDALTDLPNRTLLDETLCSAIGQHHRDGRQLFVLFLDLDRFKDVNDSLGHRVGDVLLTHVARRLEGLAEPNDLVARYGGDEFVIVAERTDAHGVLPMLDSIVSAMTEPFDLDAQELYVEVSIGVSEFPRDGADADTLLRNADAAMYLAKANGRNGYCFYRPELNVAVAERLQLSTRLRRAVKSQSLHLVYQPQVDMRSGQVLGVEALVRWTDEELGAVPPSVFIPVAEETGLIQGIGEWVIGEACRQASRWLEQGVPPIRVSVNVSPLQFERSDIVKVVRTALAEFNLPADQFEVEVTEGALMRNADDVARKLRELRNIGVSVAIDDFGTGYSSLSYLKRFSVDRIKIDRAFVQEIGADDDSEALALAVISLAHALRFEVLAEGVENIAQQEFLLKHGCHAAQGYFFSRPLLPDRCEEWLKDSLDASVV